MFVPEKGERGHQKGSPKPSYQALCLKRTFQRPRNSRQFEDAVLSTLAWHSLKRGGRHYMNSLIIDQSHLSNCGHPHGLSISKGVPHKAQVPPVLGISIGPVSLWYEAEVLLRDMSKG